MNYELDFDTAKIVKTDKSLDEFEVFPTMEEAVNYHSTHEPYSIRSTFQKRMYDIGERVYTWDFKDGVTFCRIIGVSVYNNQLAYDTGNGIAYSEKAISKTEEEAFRKYNQFLLSKEK